MLRESVEQTDQTFDLTAISGADAGGSVPHQDLLLAFAEAVVLRDVDAAGALRPKLADALGMAGFFDACGVIAGFHGFTRVADCAGVPVDGRHAPLAEEIQAQTGVRQFTGA